MSAIDLDTVVARGGDHVETRMGEQIVMMSIARGRYYALEESGQRIWELMEQPISVRSIVERLAQEYEVSPDRCAAEVVAFLQDLRAHGLLAESSG